MLAILTLLVLVSLSELSEQKSLRKPTQEPEITLFPCKKCRETGKIRTYRSIYFSETKTKKEDNYQQDLFPDEPIVPIIHDKFLLSGFDTVLKME